MSFCFAGLVTATLGDDSACAAAGDETFSGRSVAEVRAGHLLVRWDGPAGYCWKLLLRYLNLTATEHATYGFSLVRPGSISPIVTVVVSTYPVYISYIYLCRYTYWMYARRTENDRFTIIRYIIELVCSWFHPWQTMPVDQWIYPILNYR